MLTREDLDAVLKLARIVPIDVQEIPNQYYAKTTEDFTPPPWFRVTTSEGVLIIGPRKRVIEFNYVDSCKCGVLSTDDVTKSDTHIHAWNFGALVQYLISWKRMEWSKDYVREVAHGRKAIGDYFEAYAGKQMNHDPVIEKILETIDEHSSDLRKYLDPLTRKESMLLWTGRNELTFTFPVSPAA